MSVESTLSLYRISNSRGIQHIQDDLGSLPLNCFIAFIKISENIWLEYPRWRPVSGEVYARLPGNVPFEILTD